MDFDCFKLKFNFGSTESVPSSVETSVPRKMIVCAKGNDFFPCIFWSNNKVPSFEGHNFLDLMMNFGEKLHSYPERMNLRLVQEGRLGELNRPISASGPYLIWSLRLARFTLPRLGHGACQPVRNLTPTKRPL